MTVDFALLLYDEFDGASINDESVVFRHGGKIVTPLRKPEGYYVFAGLLGDAPELLITRPHYRSQHKRIIKSRLDPGFPVERARLRRNYPGNFADCEWLTGTTPPDSEVMAFAKEDVRLQAAETADRLTIPGKAAGLLLGRRFAFELSPTETFLLVGMAAPGVYTAEYAGTPQIPRDPKAALLRVYLTNSGPTGRYHIPVEPGQKERLTGTAYYDRGERQWVFASVPALS
jgi:hypothetical protein